MLVFDIFKRRNRSKTAKTIRLQTENGIEIYYRCPECGTAVWNESQLCHHCFADIRNIKKV